MDLISCVALHQGRLFASRGSKVYVYTDNETSLNTGELEWFPFRFAVEKLISTPAGLVVKHRGGADMICGGPATVTMFAQCLFTGDCELLFENGQLIGVRHPDFAGKAA